MPARARRSHPPSSCPMLQSVTPRGFPLDHVARLNSESPRKREDSRIVRWHGAIGMRFHTRFANVDVTVTYSRAFQHASL